ncbi:MAG: hypothetical protein ABIP75_10860 [Pyrinomonadaceae bacterium]
MERAEHIGSGNWTSAPATPVASTRRFAAVLIGLALVSLVLAGWLPLPFSVVTVFLFAGPHNWFELRYFISRLPARLGRSRNFFIVAFSGIGVLTLGYAAIPFFGYRWWWSGGTWLTAAATWNTAALLWVAALVVIRGRQTPRRDWNWAIPAACFLIAANWMAPAWFGLALVYLHPLVALWFLDRHLGRVRPEWQRTYRRCLAVLPVLIGVLWWNLAGTASLASDGEVAGRITTHAGSGLLPQVSSHLLVSTHVFLETLHYGVWLLAIPLIRSSGSPTAETPWNLISIPLMRHPRGWPVAITLVIAVGAVVMLILWAGFSLDYARTRDIYFTVALAHVLAEVPFLLRTV